MPFSSFLRGCDSSPKRYPRCLEACTMTENRLDPIWQVVIPPWTNMYIICRPTRNFDRASYVSICEEFPSSQKPISNFHHFLAEKGGPKRRMFICAKKPMLLGNASCHPYVWSDLNWPCDVPMISTSMRMRRVFCEWPQVCVSMSLCLQLCLYVNLHMYL